MPHYGLRDRKTGRLLRVRRNQDATECGDSFTLCLEDDQPLFLVACQQVLAAALFADTSVYNSGEDCPMWGGYTREDMEPVEVEISVTVKPVTVEVMPNLTVQDSLDMTPANAKRTLPGVELPPAQRYVFCPVDTSLPGQSRADLEARIGKPFGIGSLYHQRVLLALADLPEAYAESIRNNRWRKSDPTTMLMAVMESVGTLHAVPSDGFERKEVGRIVLTGVGA